MTAYFLDSSALIKRYLVEQGTPWIRQITDPSGGDAIIVSRITQVEVVPGIARHVREGLIMPRHARAVRLLLDRHVSREYTVVALAEQIAHHAEDLLLAHALRAYDAAQLASALDAQSEFIAAGRAPLVFVSADLRLLRAAVSEGLTTENPNIHT